MTRNEIVSQLSSLLYKADIKHEINIPEDENYIIMFFQMHGEKVELFIHDEYISVFNTIYEFDIPNIKEISLYKNDRIRVLTFRSETSISQACLNFYKGDFNE